MHIFCFQIQTLKKPLVVEISNESKNIDNNLLSFKIKNVSVPFYPRNKTTHYNNPLQKNCLANRVIRFIFLFSLPNF